MKICWTRLLLWITIGVLALGAALSGCGQKGPLYLPKEKAKQTKKKPAPKTDSDAEKTTSPAK